MRFHASACAVLLCFGVSCYLLFTNSPTSALRSPAHTTDGPRSSETKVDPYSEPPFTFVAPLPPPAEKRGKAVKANNEKKVDPYSELPFTFAPLPPPSMKRGKTVKATWQGELNLTTEVTKLDAGQQPSDPAQCKALFVCTSGQGFFLMKIFQSTKNVTEASPEARVALALGSALAKSSQPDSVVVDIGVNDGSDIRMWWRMFSQAVKHFYLFEPQSIYHRKITASLAGLEKEFPGTTAHYLRAGVGSEDMHNKEFAIAGSGYEARLLPLDHPMVKTLKAPTVVKMKNLRQLLEHDGRGNSSITFLKVDAEGADATIINASMELFRTQRVKLLVMEMHGRHSLNFPVKIPSLIQRLREIRYRTFMVGFHPSTGDTIFVEIVDGGFDVMKLFIETLVAIPEGSNVFEESGARLIADEVEIAELVTGMARTTDNYLRRRDYCMNVSDYFPIRLVRYCWPSIYVIPFESNGKVPSKTFWNGRTMVLSRDRSTDGPSYPSLEAKGE